MKKPSLLTKGERDQIRLRVRLFEAAHRRIYPDPDDERRRLIAAYAAMVERRRGSLKWVN